MSNESFFLSLMCEEFVDLENKEPEIENSLRIYYFRNYWADGTSSVYKIRFNQIGGFVDCKEVER